MDECNHYDGGDGVCVYCNHEIVQVIHTSQKVPQKGPRKHSIQKDLEAITSVPEDVRKMADTIFQEMNLPVHRGEQRKRIVLFCLYKATLVMNYPIQPKELPKLLGLRQTELSVILSLEMQQAFKNPPRKSDNIRLRSALDMLPAMAKAVGIDTTLNMDAPEQLANLTQLSQQVMGENPKLQIIAPDQMAAALVYYYFVIYFGTEDINLSGLATKMGINAVTMQNAYNEIIKV